MKRVSMLVVLALLVASPAMASMTIKMLDLTPAYDVQVVTGPVGTYAAGSTFKTFCLEANEYFYQNEVLTVTAISNSAKAGGMDWQGGIIGSTTVTSSGADLLDNRTAWLYTEFMAGNLLDEAALQIAIHYIEAERTNLGSNATAVSYFNAADAAVVGGWTNQYVGVMNNVHRDGTPAQDHLVMVPAPGAILLGSLGMGLVGWLRQRRSL